MKRKILFCFCCYIGCIYLILFPFIDIAKYYWKEIMYLKRTIKYIMDNYK